MKTAIIKRKLYSKIKGLEQEKLLRKIIRETLAEEENVEDLRELKKIRKYSKTVLLHWSISPYVIYPETSTEQSKRYLRQLEILSQCRTMRETVSFLEGFSITHYVLAYSPIIKIDAVLLDKEVFYYKYVED